MNSNKKYIFRKVEHSIFNIYFERKCTISNMFAYFLVNYLNHTSWTVLNKNLFLFVLFGYHGNQDNGSAEEILFM